MMPRPAPITQEAVLRYLLQQALAIMKDNQSSDDEWLRKQFEWIRRAEKAVR